MFFYEGYSCPVCGKLFTEGDDIVACPDCGAPHHRECWRREGRCRYEADHGTERQWSREKAAPAADGARPCPYCGQENPAYAEFCSRCGKPTGAEEWRGAPPPPSPTPPPPPYGQAPYGQEGTGYPGYGEYSPTYRPIDPCAGVPPEEIIEGVAASDLAAYVGSNTSYYLPRFARMSRKGSRIDWNWAAFFITPYWLLFRKQYLAGGIVLAINAIFSALDSFILYSVFGDELLTGSTAVALERIMSDPNRSLFVWVLVFASLAQLLLRLVFALGGNGIYLRTAARRISRMREENASAADITAAGGVSFGLAIVGYVILLAANMATQMLLL